jgi:hypothetical protein
MKSKQAISELLLWDHNKVIRFKSAKAAFSANNSRQLLKAIGKVEGVVISNKEIGN